MLQLSERVRQNRVEREASLLYLYAWAYRGFGLGGGLGIPVVSYAPLPMLVILDESKTAIVIEISRSWVCGWKAYHD